MKITVMLMKASAYATLRNNYVEVYNLVTSHSDGSWLRDYLGHDPYEATPYEIDDFVLKYDEDYSRCAVENGITLYEHLNSIPAHILTSQYFWAWINFEKAYRQAQKTLDFKSPITLRRTWFNAFDNRHELLIGAISREYFKVKFSVDESKEDKYGLTSYLFLNPSFYDMIRSRNITDEGSISRAVISVAKDIFDRTGLIITKAQGNDLLKITYQIGSVMFIDILSCEEIIEIIRPKFSEIHPELYMQS